eukprot:340999-Rhodomonas_salina.1
MSGTEIAYGCALCGTEMAYGCAMRGAGLCCYAFAMRCPVLTWAIVLAFGTGIGYAHTLCYYAFAMQYP